jgi:hypothetical protein
MSLNFLKTAFPPVVELDSPAMNRSAIADTIGLWDTGHRREGKGRDGWTLEDEDDDFTFLSPLAPLPDLRSKVRRCFGSRDRCQRPDSSDARRCENLVYAVLMRRRAHSLLSHS